MSFLQFVRILWARRALILVATAGCFLAALLVALILPARYEARSRVMLDIVKPDPVTGTMLSSQFARAYVKTQIELINDYRVAGKVVDALGWANSPELAAQYAARAQDDKRDFRRWLAQRVIDSTDAKLIEGSNILEISYGAGSSDAARLGADAVRQAYIDQTLAFKREGAARNAAWFQLQTVKLRDQLAAAEKRKNDFERENGIVLQDDNTDTEMAKLKALAATAPAAPVVSAGAAASPSAAQLAQVDAQIAAASQQLGPNHPDLINLRKQRAGLASAAAAERSSGRVSTSGPSIASMMSNQTQKVLAQRGKVNEAQRLAADVTILREQFNKSASRAGDLSQQAQSTDTGLTLLGSAVAPEDPIFPNMPLILFGSIGLGLVMGTLVALITELLSRRVRGTEDLVIGDVPVIGALARQQAESRRRSVWSWLGFDEFKTKRVTE